MAEAPIIDIVNLEKRYRSKNTDVFALQGINLAINKGDIFGVIGKSGAGKSTLLKCIDRILRPKSGEVIVDGKNVFAMSSNEMAQNVAYVAQNARAVDMSVFDTVAAKRRRC